MNAVETKYYALPDLERAAVDPSVYTGSVFASQEGFDLAMREFETVIFGTIKEDLRDKPLIYKRNKAERLVTVIPGTGLDFGFQFEHKFTREPLLTVVVSKDTDWTYESSAKQDDGTVVERSATLTVASKEDLLNAVIAELSADLAHYTGKRLTFK